MRENAPELPQSPFSTTLLDLLLLSVPLLDLLKIGDRPMKLDRVSLSSGRQTLSCRSD